MTVRRFLAFAALLACGLGPAPAPAAEPARPTLRAAVTVAAELVTIGDFFDNAGPLADRAIFRAPDLGTTGTVPAWRVLAEARAAGLREASEGLLVEVSVTRSAREIGAGEIQSLVAAALARQMGVADARELQVTFDQPLEPRLADERSPAPVRIASVNSVPGNGRFEALVLIDKGAAPERLRLRGQATEVVDTVVLTRPLARGEVLRAEDLVVQRVPKRQAGANRPAAVEDFAGLAARRALRAETPLTAGDVQQPLLVKRGETITLVYQSPGLVLSARAQALEQGSLGDVITVLNPQSKRTVVGTVSGPGRVTVGPGGTSVASLGRAQQ
ncbi:flagellar basal body P-ring formation chaperone FlgA [Prosthecomicrobium sp. N25]|uniref:flagellar basal body P-ring formation chaperone FlgA n=1 Tax=Prosthecomicrobium sp. N25 TaxID=3129254 RepID=UPI0030780CE5